MLDEAHDALRAAFAEEIRLRFAAFNAWTTAAPAEAEGDPKARFERSLRQLKKAFADAEEIIDRVFACALLLVFVIVAAFNAAHAAGSVRGVEKCDRSGAHCTPCQYLGNGKWDCSG